MWLMADSERKAHFGRLPHTVRSPVTAAIGQERPFAQILGYHSLVKLVAAAFLLPSAYASPASSHHAASAGLPVRPNLLL
jgi:hypothetical protein